MFLLGAAAALGGRALLAPKAMATTEITAIGDWRLVCPPAVEKNASCSLQQEVQAGPGEGTVLRLSLHGQPQQLMIGLPHGVLLPPGIGIRLGKAAMKLRPYRTCDIAGCEADTAFDAGMKKDFLDGGDARIVFAAANGKALGVAFSLKEFPAAYAALERAEAQRGSWLRRSMGW